MTNILLLEDVPEASAWLKVQASEVFTEPVFFEASRVNAALAIILFIGVTPILIYNIRVLRRERTIR